jgi:hypothetical protein
MIPKIIHYVWLGHGLMPQSQKDCIRSWQEYMPDYEIKLWNESNFDLSISPYCLEAYKLKKYGVAVDVIKLSVLNEFGGIYMDTDVEVYKSLEPFLKYSAFSGLELYPNEFEKEGRHLLDENMQPIVKGTNIPYCGILSSIIGAEPQNPYIQKMLDFYKNRPALNENGEFNLIVLDGAMATLAVEQGFQYEDKYQNLKDIVIFPSSVFAYAGIARQNSAYTYHYTAWSWNPKTTKQKIFIWLDKLGILKPYRKIKRRIKSNLLKGI